MGPHANVKGRLNVNGNPAAMRIGELARRSGLSTSRIRFYEAKGLINVVSRKANGYREYAADALIILGIIVGAQQTGFSLDEIRQILPADLSSWRSGKLVDALRRKVADIARMEKQLARSKKQLCALIRKIEGKPNGIDCTDNTKRLLKEFVLSGSRPASTMSKKGGARSRDVAAVPP
jgi:DNA-binding transcriptional MerR regulator